MADPLRKQKIHIASEPQFKIANDNKKFERDAVNDNLDKDTQEFEKQFGTIPDTVRKLGSGPHLNIFKSNVKLLDDFRVQYKRELAQFGEQPRMAVVNPGRHVEAQFVFKNADIFGLVETQAEADAMEKLGVPTKKCDPETHLMDDRVDVMFAFYDESAEATWKFCRNIAAGGLLLCRGPMAKEILENSGDFRAIGTLQKGAPAAQVEKSRREDYWEHAVKTDAEFKAASEKLPPGGTMVTYREAIDALNAANKPTGEKTQQVLDNYKALLKEATENGGTMNDETGTITYTPAGAKEPLKWKTDLPLGTVDDSIVFVLKKRKMGVN
ncbi:hypothetical protein HYW59_01295 [Candidatus Kaiserbacteria bacterium]|nr:hypothetical protein [Candidatus Kaiserbacteria bacterium]